MAALMKIMQLSQPLFGTDYPFMTLAEHVKGLEDCGLFTAPELEAMAGSNARALLAISTAIS
jgi:hypothetical protein